jgi:hypothetical protein
MFAWRTMERFMSLEHSPARNGLPTNTVSEPSYTVSEFCAAERMSRAQLYKAWKEGWGPKYYRNGNRRIITPTARRAWQVEREKAAHDGGDQR